MPKLMISLDNKIFDKESYAAKRMISYGLADKLYIIVPYSVDKFFELSPEVKVWGIGGNKIQQFKKLREKGLKIINKHIIDLITTQDPFFTGLIGVYLKKKTKIKLEVQLHGDFFSSNYYKKSGVKNFLQHLIAKNIVIPKADKLRVVGERVKVSLLKMGVKAEKIDLRSVKIDEEYIRNFEPKTNLKNKYQHYKKIFLCIGRLEPVKNIVFLIDVFAEVIKKNKKYLLLIVGSGSKEIVLKEKVKGMGLESNIKFEDWTDDHISYLKTCDCVLFPSLSEGYGLVPTEAFECGTKVIMSDVGVANFELKSSENVVILPINNKEKFVEEINKV